MLAGLVGWLADMHRILVIGATGNIGREVVSQLAAAGVAVRAMVRNPESLDRCLDGIDTVFLVWVAPPDAVGPAIERIARHAKRVVFLSAPLKTPHPFFQQPNASRALVDGIESLIEASGLEWTYLRPGMLASNAVLWWASRIRAGEVVRWPYLDVPTAPIDERDIAAVAVRALCEDGHGGAEYVLTGPESLTQREQLATIARVIGREVPVEEASPEAWMADSGLAPFIAKMLAAAWGAGAGRAAFVSPTFGELMGRGPRSFAEWVRDHAGAFGG